MRIYKFNHVLLTLLIAIVSTPLLLSLDASLGEMQVLATMVDATKKEADRLLDQGEEQYQTSQFEAALQSWRQALSIYRQINDRQSQSAALGNIGDAYLHMEDNAKAIDYSNQLLKLAREIKDLKSEGKALVNIGNAYLNMGDYPKAIDYSNKSLTIARQIKDRPSVGRALANIGIAYLHMRDYPKALDNISDAYLNLGEYARAIGYSNQLLKLAREIKDIKSEGKALGYIGVAYLSIGDYAKAIDYSNQQLKRVRQIKDRPSVGNALNNIGIAYLSIGDYPSSIDYLNQWLIIARQIKDRESVGIALGRIGSAYLNMGDYPSSIDYFNQALTIAREIKDRESEGKALGSISITYSQMGDNLSSIDYSNQWLTIAREIKDRESEGKALSVIGITYLNVRDYPSSINYFNQALTIARQFKYRPTIGIALGNIGSAYLSMGDYPKAINYLNQWLTITREIKDRQSEGAALGNIGHAYSKMGDYPLSIDYLNQALTIARQIKARRAEGAFLSNLGHSFYKSGNLSLAEEHLLSSIKVHESLRDKKLNDANKVSLLETQISSYISLQKVYIAQNKTDAALEIAERSRARAFVELISERLSNKTLSTQISSQPLQINQIQQIAKTQNTTLVQYSIIYDDFNIAGTDQSQESELYIWVIKPSGNITFRKVDLKPLWQKDNTTLSNLVTTVRNNIGARGIHERGIFKVSYNPDTIKTRNNLRHLHKLLINPVADLLPKNENDRVAFIPQGGLFLVPFSALQDANGKYLIQKHTILTSPSIQVLDLTHKQREAQKTPSKDVLIVGNPTMPFVPPKVGATPQQLAPLPGAEREAKAIGNLLNTKPLIGNEATKAAVRMRLPHARFVHLATHGIFNEVQGINSSIALAPNLSANKQSDKNDDGLLTAGEILDLKLNAELVVLSACNTGRGEITGDGVIGLSRALISAGVPSVLVSLWSVPDAPTAQLMTEFYKNLQKSPDKAQALRQAMLTTMKNSPNPVDWAAFTLIGDVTLR